MGSEDGGIILLPAKGSARLSLNDAHLFFRQIKDGQKRFVHVERTLQRAPNGDAGFAFPLGDDAVVLNVQMFLRAGSVFSFNNVRGRVPHRIDVALLKHEAFKDVVRTPDDWIAALTVLDGKHCRERIIFNAHRLRCLAQFVLVMMRQQENRFVAVVHFAVGEAGLIGGDQLNDILAGNVVSGDDGELGPIDATIIANGANEPPRNGTAHGSAVPHSLAFDVVHIARPSHHFVHPFLAGD